MTNSYPADPWQTIEDEILNLRKLLLSKNKKQFIDDLKDLLQKCLAGLCDFLNKKYQNLGIDLAATEYISSASIFFKEHFREVKEVMEKIDSQKYETPDEDIVRALSVVDKELEGLRDSLSKIHPSHSFPFLKYLDRNIGGSMYLIYADQNSDIEKLKKNYPRAIVISFQNREKFVNKLETGNIPLREEEIKEITFDDRNYVFTQLKQILQEEVMRNYSPEKIIYDCSRVTIALSHKSFLKGPWKDSLRSTLNIPVFLGLKYIGDVVFTSKMLFEEAIRTLVENFAHRLLVLLYISEQLLLDRFIHLGSFMPLAQARELIATSVNEILKNVQSHEATVLLVDIRGFSEKVNKYLENSKDKTIFPQMLNEFRKKIITAIWEEGGIVDKFIGDAVMAVFLGNSSETSLKSIKAAIKMVQSLEDFNLQFQEKWEGLSGKNDWEPWNIGIGIATGNVLLGIFGINYRYEFTAIGQLVNKVARMVDEARGVIKDDGREIQTTIIVDDAIYKSLPPGKCAISELGNFILKRIGQKAIRSKLYYVKI